MAGMAPIQYQCVARMPRLPSSRCPNRSFLPGGVDGDGAGQVGAFDEFHHKSPGFDAVGSGDVGVIWRGEDLRFALEALHARCVFCKGRREQLDGDVAIQLGVRGAIHRTHPVLAGLGRDSIVVDG